MLRRLGAVDVIATTAAPTSALGDWYLNLLHIGRDQLVMATSERSLLTVLLPARELRTSLAHNLAETTWRLLVEIGVAPERAATEAEEMRAIAFARTASRSVLGCMNDFAVALDWHWRDGLAPMEIMLRLAETPKRAIPDGKFNFGIPREVARRLLAGQC
jgi:hypothetical protein